MNKFISYIIIIFEITLIIWLTQYIYIKFSKYNKSTINIAKIEKEDLKCDISVLQNYCELIPDSVWVNEGNTSDSGKLYYNINSNGFNSNSIYPTIKDIGTYRILAMGDSHTFGLFVKTSESYPALLEKYLNSSEKCSGNIKYEVLNLGFPGDDPIYSSYRYQKIGQIYKPDLIIWYIKEDDFFESTDEITALWRACEKNGTYLGNCWGKSYTDFYSDSNFVKNSETNRQNNYNTITNFVKNIQESKILFFTYKDIDHKNLTFLKNLQNANIFLDNQVPYDKIPRFINDNHPTSEGYKIIASNLKEFILSDILKCNQND